MTRNRRNPAYIETDPDGGYQTIELWCYQEAEAECDNLTDRLKLAENELSATRQALAESIARETGLREAAASLIAALARPLHLWLEGPDPDVVAWFSRVEDHIEALRVLTQTPAAQGSSK